MAKNKKNKIRGSKRADELIGTNESDFTKLDFVSCNFINLENKFIIANFK